TCAQGLVLVITASTLGVSVANKGWSFGTILPPKNSSHHLNYTDRPNKIIVGGSDHWHYGFNYSEWAFKNSPFYLNDTLVFKYDPPSNINPFAHSIYLLPNYWSYLKCDLRAAKIIANTTQGGGEGFEFTLKRWQPYFACGEHNGVHCNNGTMKFFIMPLFR
ncbi:LOW QUALITY PROTEIN: Cu_bind_like domain-containing protein, partial [Cephalotus follicularis]